MDFTYRGIFVSDNSEIVTFFGPGQSRDRYYCEIGGIGHWAVSKRQIKDLIAEQLEA